MIALVLRVQLELHSTALNLSQNFSLQTHWLVSFQMRFTGHATQMSQNRAKIGKDVAFEDVGGKFWRLSNNLLFDDILGSFMLGLSVRT